MAAPLAVLPVAMNVAPCDDWGPCCTTEMLSDNAPAEVAAERAHACPRAMATATSAGSDPLGMITDRFALMKALTLCVITTTASVGSRAAERDGDARGDGGAAGADMRGLSDLDGCDDNDTAATGPRDAPVGDTIRVAERAVIAALVGVLGVGPAGTMNIGGAADTLIPIEGEVAGVVEERAVKPETSCDEVGDSERGSPVAGIVVGVNDGEDDGDDEDSAPSDGVVEAPCESVDVGLTVPLGVGVPVDELVDVGVGVPEGD